MRRLGKVLHLSKSGNLILRLDSPQIPPDGSEVCNHKLEKIGMVNSILGPVKTPYASVQPSIANTSSLKGRILYLVEKE